MTSSLGDSREDLHAVEARRCAGGEETANSIGTAVPPVDIYEVELADQADGPT